MTRAACGEVMPSEVSSVRVFSVHRVLSRHLLSLLVATLGLS